MRTAVALSLLVLVAGCGTATRAPDAAGGPGPMPTTAPVPDGPVRARYVGLVLEGKDGSNQLCFGYIADSLPPQCTGLPVSGWDWSEHRSGSHLDGGVHWGDYGVEGIYDGSTFSLTTAVPGAQYDSGPLIHDDEPSTPCSEPAGGWTVDSDLVSEDAALQAGRLAQALPDYANVWHDWSRETRSPEEVDQTGSDYSTLTINVEVTGDSEAAEQAIRKVWGGGLCVVNGTITEREIETITSRVAQLPGQVYAGGRLHSVEVTVLYDDGSLQDWCDATYGRGVVNVRSALVPLPVSG